MKFAVSLDDGEPFNNHLTFDQVDKIFTILVLKVHGLSCLDGLCGVCAVPSLLDLHSSTTRLLMPFGKQFQRQPK